MASLHWLKMHFTAQCNWENNWVIYKIYLPRDRVGNRTGLMTHHKVLRNQAVKPVCPIHFPPALCSHSFYVSVSFILSLALLYPPLTSFLHLIPWSIPLSLSFPLICTLPSSLLSLSLLPLAVPLCFSLCFLLCFCMLIPFKPPTLQCEGLPMGPSSVASKASILSFIYPGKLLLRASREAWQAIFFVYFNLYLP